MPSRVLNPAGRASPSALLKREQRPQGRQKVKEGLAVRRRPLRRDDRCQEKSKQAGVCRVGKAQQAEGAAVQGSGNEREAWWWEFR